MATSGPGATNLVTPIADAYMDSVPIVAITGQVPSSAIGTDAFQEADICGITMPITKHNYLVQRAEDIPRTLAEAFHIASTGRPGPVLVDIPKDILQAHAPSSTGRRVGRPARLPAAGKPHGKQVREAARLIVEAKRPVLYVGGGVLKARAAQELRVLAELDRHPGRHDADGARRVPRQPPAAPGHARACTARSAAVLAFQQADLLICLGARFDDRVTGKLATFAPNADGHPRRRRPGRDLQEPHGRRADRRRRARGDRRPHRRGAGRARRGPHGRLRRPGGRPLERLARRRTRSATTDHADGTLAPQHVIERIGADRRPGRHLRRRRRPAPDVGEPVHRASSTRTRGSTPAASARWATPSRRRWARRSAARTSRSFAIDGDGCFQMTNQELVTCAIEGIPIKVMVINNGSLGMVRQWQTLFYERALLQHRPRSSCPTS